ncbi:MAG TPA: adenosylcobinamide-GDP ribazoletransferase [Syntrophorhabdaceae bacterium]
MKELLISLQFLTRIPVRITGSLSERQIGRSAIFFPFVGVVQGAAAACTAVFMDLLFNPEIAAGFVVVVPLLINGGFHIDGLADTVDGMSVKGTGEPSRDRERRLTVMKDSSIGAMGAAAIAVLVLIKYLFASGLIEKGLTWDVLFMIFFVPVFSKWIMVPVICHGKAARNDGLGKIFIAHGGTGVLLLSSVILAAIFACASFALPEPSWRGTGKVFLLLFLSSYGLALLWVAFCQHKFGGLTGDTIGAVSEIGEILLFGIAFLCI